MAKKNSGSTAAAVGIGALVLIAAVPREAWIVIGIIVVVCFILYAFMRSRQSKAKDVPAFKQASYGSIPAAEELGRRNRVVKSFERPPRTTEPSVVVAQPVASKDEEPVRIATAPENRSFRLPDASKGKGPAQWIPAGQAVTVDGLTIPGGMVYVGATLRTPSGGVDPSLIDPSKQVAKYGDFTQRAMNEMGYWPSYSEISPNSRRAYLEWLAGGRSHSEADIGFVFLFFYGLERRLLVDGSNDANLLEAELPGITQELRRLLSIYGRKSGSFLNYATQLLDWASVVRYKADLYNSPIPEFSKAMELPLYVRLALGRAALDGVPVPAHLALEWAKLDPNSSLRTPAIRCGEEFDKLFVQKYTESFGVGLALPRNRTKLRFVYRAASAGLRGLDPTLTFPDVPDVSALTAPVKKVQKVVEDATKALESYSRYVGKNPDAKSALEGLLQLPATLWPPEAQQVLATLKARMGEGMIALSFQELLTSLDAKSALTRDKTLALARALESLNIGIEPDVLGGAKLPKPDEKVVLFSVPPGEELSRATPAYQAAALTLQLASAVATADGDFSVAEMTHLRTQVQSWTHLTPNHIRRLLAHLRLLMLAPASLTSLKKKLEPLDAAAKEAVAAFMATVAQSDGAVSPMEVKMLEKVYKALGIEPKKVFSDVHAAAAGTRPAPGAEKVATTGFKLDPARIAALQKDTEKVSALLAGIFAEVEAAPALVEELAEEEGGAAASLLGLDEAHAAFARSLLSRPQWTRAELMDLAADLELMLDGALERINEASFDAYDAPFTEGDDPVDINTEVFEKIAA
ncbi:MULTISPECIES: TerB N-terminal domain-containing protein [unclassified Variovorax]|uniref:tellurite resistance TerB family protein n=1 Tax=unclassified Variovorax TaxID=663243 RepID=UPI0008B3C9E6|nr:MULTISPECIES: TerB N-terminal domain-containing protein [unclassified Variovorax]SEK16219.1 Uncharacterized conserved protein, tellurite resistance protein B (TerB) family [Variovorax sp. OK202]SFE42017.1 Uncharacterized conserved protein, tellurite resistance protein B (TerB) family [Variovorax sp. OK212]